MAYIWVPLSLISAFTLATSDALTKKALTDQNEYLVAWSRLVFSVPVLAGLLIFVPFPELHSGFYKAFAFALPLEIIAMILYIKALKISPLSLTLPFLTLTPVFLIIVSYVILGEKVTVKGAVGIFLLAAGSYSLYLHEMRNGILEPLKAVMKEKGSVLMILVAFIYSITSSLGKMAIEYSSPLFFGASYFIVMTILFTPVALMMGRNNTRTFIQGKKYSALILPGIFYSIMIASHMLAMSLTKVAYMISLKRTSVIIGVIYGYFFFTEKNIRARLSGVFLMFIGFVMIVTSS
jgi:drug/metabolite transporter (DMT)-like permease